MKEKTMIADYERDKIAPCGAACAECARFPAECAGCRQIEGRVYWLEFTGETLCPVYRCCVKGKNQLDCGNCGDFPCDKFVKDPTISDEENAAHLSEMVRRIKRG